MKLLGRYLLLPESMLKTIKKSSFYQTLIILILGLASFLRLFRVQDLLGFWYDQGRDALVIWDLIHKGKFFLIGPTTGIEGIFRGPWYYWLITPTYFLGKGNPVFPAVFLIIISVFSIYVLIKVGEEIGGKKLALLASFIAAASFYIITTSRWLSNPTPMLLIGITLIWAVFRFLDKKSWSLPLIAFLVGMALNFGSAMEIFYIPALVVIFIWKRKLLPNYKIILLSFLVFLSIFVPQLIFELRHPGVLSGPIIQFLFHENSFSLAFWDLVKSRLAFYYSVFYSKFWINGANLFAPFLILTAAFLVYKWKTFFREDKFTIIFIFAITPLIGGLFFSGNYGNIYDYYFSGYYLIFILLFSILMINIARHLPGKILLIGFLAIFIFKNIVAYKDSYLLKLSDYKTVNLGVQLTAIDWIYREANGRAFNVDEYVPPVIPYAYDYLFKWLGETKYKFTPLSENIPLLYTLYEQDIDHPERLQAWLDRQKGIGRVIKEDRFGIIIVQERERIK